MQGENIMQGYAMDGRSPEQRELAELKEAMEKQRRPGIAPMGDGRGYADLRRDDTPDHLRVSNMVNLLATDMRQLLEEINELRARLAPILSEQKQPPMGNPPNAPVHCKMAAELGDVLATLQQARQLVSVTLSQLDL